MESEPFERDQRDQQEAADLDDASDRPLLVWAEDDTPRMGRSGRLAYAGFVIAIAVVCVWVVKQDMERSTTSEISQVSNEPRPSEDVPPVADDVTPEPSALEPPTPVPDVDDLQVATKAESPEPVIPTAPVEQPKAPPKAPPVAVTRPLPVTPERPPARVAQPERPPLRSPEPVRPPPLRATQPEPPRPRVTQPEPSPPRATQPEPSPPRAVQPERPPVRGAEPPRLDAGPPRVAVAETISPPLPRVPVDEPALVPPVTPPPNEPVTPPAPSVAARSTPAAEPAPATVARPVADVEGGAIRDVLGRYRSAFNALDAKAAQQVWPTVNQRTLDRAFGQLEAQNVSFDNCRIDVKGVIAEARCSGTTRFVPRVGSRSPQVEPRQWSFSLRKAYSGSWQIQEVQAR